MKINTLKLLGCAALSACFALISQAQSVSSTPVGYITYTVNANTDARLGIPMEQASSYIGAVASVAAGTIDAGSAVGDLTSAAHYVKVTSGTLAGNWYEITGASGNSITVAEDLAAAGLAADDTFQATPFWTLNTLLPSGGNLPASANVFDASSVVFTFDPSASGTNIPTSSGYLYHSGEQGPAGWYNSSNPALGLQNDTVINPDLHVMIRNLTSSSASLVIAGTVPSAITALNIVSSDSASQDNLVYNPYPSDITLGTSNLYGSGAVSGSPNVFSPTDVVFIFDAAASGYNKPTSAGYLYHTGEQGPAGWYNSSNPALGPQDNVVIGEGEAIMIRKASGANANVSWTPALPYTL